MPQVLQNKSTLAALDLTLEKISLPFTYEQGDDRFPVSYSLDYFILMQINTRSIDILLLRVNHLSTTQAVILMQSLGEWK